MDDFLPHCVALICNQQMIQSPSLIIMAYVGFQVGFNIYKYDRLQSVGTKDADMCVRIFHLVQGQDLLMAANDKHG